MKDEFSVILSKSPVKDPPLLFNKTPQKASPVDGCAILGTAEPRNCSVLAVMVSVFSFLIH